MKPVLPDAGSEDRDASSAARPSFTIDAALGAVLEANAAGWALWGRTITPSPDAAAPPVPPLVLDTAMPALKQLAGLARAGHGRSNEALMFWTPRGARQLQCSVRRVRSGQSVFAVNVLDEVRDRPGARGTGDVPAASRLAHELRTPLSAVIAYAEVLKDEHFGPLGSPRYREYARNIYDSARHALGVVDGMLAARSALAELPDPAFADLDPAAIVDTCLATARPLAEEAGLELAAEVEPRSPRIVADEVALKQMLLNLLTNAIKFGRRGDKVTVGVAYEPGGALRIAVADTGPGMTEPPLALEGGKAANGRSRVHSAGLGIGLPLTRALAEANGAVLVIDSAPGRGTRVTLAFGKDRVVPV
jgi:signal transduction histidine kinase